MKKILVFATAMAALLAIGFTAQAQTNPPTPPSFGHGWDEIIQALTETTNWSVVAGGGQSLEGKKRIAFGAIAYNFNPYVGIVAGGDYMQSFERVNPQSEKEAVKGGVTLNAPGHLLAFVGSTFLTNIQTTLFVADLLAQPTGDDPIGNITTIGLNFNIVSFSNFELGGGLQEEHRIGQGYWNGDYLMAHLAFTRRF